VLIGCCLLSVGSPYIVQRLDTRVDHEPWAVRSATRLRSEIRRTDVQDDAMWQVSARVATFFTAAYVKKRPLASV
jgi:hypothetical protein